MELKRLFASITLVSFFVLQTGCYTVHTVTLEEFGKAQEGGEAALVSMNTDGGQKVVVSENTRIGVVTSEGKYLPISPFNFTMTSQQIIAPDQDLMLQRSIVEKAQVKQISTGKTSALVAGSLAVIIGGILFATLAPSGDQTRFQNTPRTTP